MRIFPHISPIKNSRSSGRRRFLGTVLPDSGFTLIISVLISSILLSIGLAMFNISLKESVLTSTGQESQASFFAADSGMECVRYWDRPTIINIFDAELVANSIQCGNMAGYSDVTIDGSACAGGVCTHNLTLKVGLLAEECAEITIVKDSVTPETIVESRGYNTCDTNHPRRTERGIRVSN